MSVERGYTVPETWKRYHFRAEPPCIGHYRKYLLRGVTSRCLQSGDQLGPISTNSTCIGWVSHLYMNMFKMLELWCPSWIAPVKIHIPIWFFPIIARALFHSLFRSSLWFVDCCLCFICTSCLWPATLFNDICFSCLVFVQQKWLESVKRWKFVFLESDPDISGFTCIET